MGCFTALNEELAGFPIQSPPSNQIIQVTVAKPALEMRTMDMVWVSGVMRVDKRDTEMGQAGYQLKADRVVPYP